MIMSIISISNNSVNYKVHHDDVYRITEQISDIEWDRNNEATKRVLSYEISFRTSNTVDIILASSDLMITRSRQEDERSILNLSDVLKGV